MIVKALRGVCIGVNEHLLPGDTADLDAAMVTYLTGIGAVAVVTEPPAKLEPEPQPDKPVKKEK